MDSISQRKFQEMFSWSFQFLTIARTLYRQPTKEKLSKFEYKFRHCWEVLENENLISCEICVQKQWDLIW